MPIVGYRVPGAYSTVQNIQLAVSAASTLYVPVIVGPASQGSNQPLLFFTQQDVQNEYGPPTISNPLSLGALLAFQNGAPGVMTLNVIPASSTPAYITGAPIASGSLISSSFAIQDDSFNTPVTINTPSTPASNTSLENTDILVNAINTTFGITVTADNASGTTNQITLTNLIPGSVHTINISGTDPGIAGFTAGETANGTDGILSDNDFINAFTSLLSTQLPAIASVIVPLNTSTTVQSGLQAHVDLASSENYRAERIGLVSGPITETYTTTINNAEALDDERIYYIFPTGGFRYDPINQVVNILDGSYLCAALSGLITAYDPSTPILNKTIVGFQNLLNNGLSLNTLNSIASSGVLILSNKNAIIKVRDAISTNTASDTTSQMSVVRGIDNVSITLRNTLQENFLGTKIVSSTISLIQAATISILSSMVSQQQIAAFQSPTATQDQSDPTQIDISVAIAPVYPLRYIQITISLYLNSAA